MVFGPTAMFAACRAQDAPTACASLPGVEPAAMCRVAMVALDESLHRRLLEVREILMYSFDFEVLAEPLTPEWFEVPTRWLPALRVLDADWVAVGRDAMAGVFVLCEMTSGGQCCLHVDAQGHVAVVGRTLHEAVTLIVLLPYWRELLTASAGDLTTMQRVAAVQEQEIAREFPQIPAARADLVASVRLERVVDPVARLYEVAVRQRPPVSVMSPHGWQYQSLV